MNKGKARDPLSQKILDLTLEMIFLLTGEGHMVVKIHETVSNSSRHHISEGHDRSQSFDMELPLPSGIHEQIHEKILELSNQIIRLLTGEVPIRCEDVTVHLSMEEWEYVEQHKDLYEDVMMEDHQPVFTLDKPVSGGRHPPVSFSDFGTANRTNSLKLHLIKAPKEQAESAAYTKQEPLDSGETRVPENDIYPTAECARYPPTDPKDEPDSCEEEIDTDIDCSENTQPKNTSTYAGTELDSDGGDLPNPDVNPYQDQTQTEYPSDVRKESPTREGGNVKGRNKSNPPEHTQTEWSPVTFNEYLKGKTNPLEIMLCEPSMESGKPDHSPDHPDIIVQNSVNFSTSYGEHSTPESVLKQQHIRTEEQPFSRPECEKHFTNRIVTKKHRWSRKREKAFQCSECGKCFNWASHLATHKLIHTRAASFKCPECGKGFRKAATFAKHKMIHTEEKPFKCPECGKCFTQASRLARHKKIHTGEKTFKCPECGKCFTQASRLARHKKIHTGEKPFKCPECGKRFTQASHLARHIMIHTGEKPFKCPECGKCFTQASCLARHKKIHTGKKKYHCSECGKYFSHASSLATHKMIHTGDKTYHCSQCGKQFNRAFSLTAHVMRHRGEKPFKCPECEKCFTQAAHLARHKAIHTGEKPYRCFECGKCFSWASSLSAHKMIHMEEKPFKCPECGKCFSWAASLLKHKRAHVKR